MRMQQKWEISTGGMSVYGIVKEVMDLWKKLDEQGLCQYPGQYSLSVDPETNKAVLVRDYTSEWEN